MRVSLLIHNLNRASILRECLRSVASQTYRPLEVVLLDAGSEDESPAVIAEAAAEMRRDGIEVRTATCPRMGVSASRNYAEQIASGDLLCFLDNDATFCSAQEIARMADFFEDRPRLGLVSFRVLRGNSSEIDSTTWVFRRPPEQWADRGFPTFTFAGGAFCVRSRAFRDAGGFWSALTYSREEEDMALALIDRGWEIDYSPVITVRHFADQRGRSSQAQRRYVELRNGLLVLWRRLPWPVALAAIAGRVCTMALRARVTEKLSLASLLRAVPEAFLEWRRSNLKRSPIRLQTLWKYAALHFSS